MGHKRWEEVDHTADWSIRVYGRDLAELLENAAYGMTAILGGQQSGESPVETWRFRLSALDAETLLIDWLTELIWLIEKENVLFSQFVVEKVGDMTVEARATGMAGAAFAKHIKAATYHHLNIRQAEDGLETVIVFDV